MRLFKKSGYLLEIQPKGIAAQRQGKNIPPSSGVTEKERGGEKIELTRT
jgi:hypothetical protein